MMGPRFRIGSVLLLVVFSALVLGIAAVTRENERLRRELASVRAIGSSLVFTVGPDDFISTGNQLTLFRPGPAARAMPNGSEAFESANDSTSREIAP